MGKATFGLFWGFILLLALSACSQAELAETAPATITPSQTSTPVVCPDFSLASLEIELVSEAANVAVTAVAQPGGVQTITCTSQPAANCQAYLLPLSGPGTLQLNVEGLDGTGPMQVNDGIVSYAWRDSQLILRQNNLAHSLTVTGADTLQATLEVTLDEIGCPLAQFRTLAVQAEPDLSSGEPHPPLRIFQRSNLTMTDLSAAACQSEPQPYPVRFEAKLPHGTALADLSALIFTAGKWQPAECAVADGRFHCTAILPNPLINQPYAYKIVAGDEEYVGSSLPFDNLCLLFD